MVDSGKGDSSSRLPKAQYQNDSQPSFLSLGMVVLDELRFPSKQTLYDVIGGSGAYSSLGARLTTSHALSHTVASIVLAGEDFPTQAIKMFESWGSTLDIRVVTGRKSTRGLLQYEDDAFGRKTFRYTTTPLQPTPKDIENTILLQSSAFHLLGRPEDADRQITDLQAKRAKKNIMQNPLLVWEPAPPHCKSINLEAHIAVCKRVDVFSPNHIELAQLFEDEGSSTDPFDRSITEGYARRLHRASLRDDDTSSVIVVRAGEHGCLILSSGLDCRWLPTYFDPKSATIVDPTGAGNCFLGAFTRILNTTGDLIEAATHGSVAASFALEQFGLPRLQRIDDQESWNGSTYASRLAKYRARLS